METAGTIGKRAKTGGRQKGTQNRRTINGEKKANRECRRVGVDPMRVLAEQAKSAKDEKIRFGAACKLAEYIHGKPKEKLELSGGLTAYDAVAKARARVTAFEQRPKPAAPAINAPAPAPSPAEIPTFAEWKTENGLDAATEESAATESADVDRGKLRRVVTQ